MALPTNEQITEKLRAVIDPELRRSIVDLGMVRSIEVRDGGRVEVVVSLTTPGCPIRSHFQQAVAQQVGALDGVSAVEGSAVAAWRGPMRQQGIQQVLEDVGWSELEYLVLDLPPGTGDVSMTLAPLLPPAKSLIATTPQPAAQSVASRAAEMARKVDL